MFFFLLQRNNDRKRINEQEMLNIMKNYQSRRFIFAKSITFFILCITSQGLIKVWFPRESFRFVIVERGFNH